MHIYHCVNPFDTSSPLKSTNTYKVMATNIYKYGKAFINKRFDENLNNNGTTISFVLFKIMNLESKRVL